MGVSEKKRLKIGKPKKKTIEGDKKMNEKLKLHILNLIFTTSIGFSLILLFNWLGMIATILFIFGQNAATSDEWKIIDIREEIERSTI